MVDLEVVMVKLCLGAGAAVWGEVWGCGSCPSSPWAPVPGHLLAEEHAGAGQNRHHYHSPGAAVHTQPFFRCSTSYTTIHQVQHLMQNHSPGAPAPTLPFIRYSSSYTTIHQVQQFIHIHSSGTAPHAKPSTRCSSFYTTIHCVQRLMQNHSTGAPFHTQPIIRYSTSFTAINLSGTGTHSQPLIRYSSSFTRYINTFPVFQIFFPSPHLQILTVPKLFHYLLLARYIIQNHSSGTASHSQKFIRHSSSFTNIHHAQQLIHNHSSGTAAHLQPFIRYSSSFTTIHQVQQLTHNHYTSAGTFS